MTPADLQRIGFVTKRFGDLQGLRTVAFGAALLLGLSVRDVSPPGFGESIWPVVLFASFLGGGARTTLDGYYRRTFGSTSAGSGIDWRTLPPRSHFMFLPDAVVTVLAIDVMLTGFLDVRIGIASVVLFVYCLRTVIHDWPHRTYYAIGAVAGVAAVIIIAAAPPRLGATHLIDPRIGEYLGAACGLIGFALVVIGLLDHRLLVHAMWRRPSADGGERRPATHLATTRIVVAGWVATAIVTYFSLSAWPLHRAIVLGIVGTFMLVLLMFGGAWPDMSYGFRAIKARAREREAVLLARIEGRASPLAKDTPMNELPAPDFWGHLALPVAMAAGALADIPFRGSGLPSFLAIAVAASHVRIATRDWPDRKHYLLGATAAAIGAVQHAFIGNVSATDWALSFLMLMSGATLIEGLLDRRLESNPRPFANEPLRQG